MIWNPTVCFAGQRVARVVGWYRAFCLATPPGKGSLKLRSCPRARPGRALQWCGSPDFTGRRGKRYGSARCSRQLTCRGGSSSDRAGERFAYGRVGEGKLASQAALFVVDGETVLLRAPSNEARQTAAWIQGGAHQPGRPYRRRQLLVVQPPPVPGAGGFSLRLEDRAGLGKDALAKATNAPVTAANATPGHEDPEVALDLLRSSD
jgi:hypothetical protein